MKNIFQLFKQEPFSIKNTEWFLLTQNNYQINGRKLFTQNNGKIDLNPYFLYDRFNEIKEFNMFYVSSFADVNEEEIDYDFQVGFNNLDPIYEKRLILSFFSGKNLHVIIRPNFYVADFSKINPLFNKKSNEYIEFNYNVVYKNLENIPTFIIGLENLNQLIKLQEFTYGYLLNKFKNSSLRLTEIASFNELEVLDFLMNQYETVILRTFLFGNYNLTIYTRYLNAIKINKQLKKYAKSMGVELQEEVPINSERNLLRYW